MLFARQKHIYFSEKFVKIVAFIQVIIIFIFLIDEMFYLCHAPTIMHPHINFKFKIYIFVRFKIPQIRFYEIYYKFIYATYLAYTRHMYTV